MTRETSGANPTDASSAGAAVHGDPNPTTVEHPWWALTALLVGLSIIIIDGSVVNVLLPDMVKDLGLTQTGAQWVNSIYSLVFASLLRLVERRQRVQHRSTWPSRPAASRRAGRPGEPGC